MDKLVKFNSRNNDQQVKSVVFDFHEISIPNEGRSFKWYERDVIYMIRTVFIKKSDLLDTIYWDILLEKRKLSGEKSTSLFKYLGFGGGPCKERVRYSETIESLRSKAQSRGAKGINFPGATWQKTT